MSYSKNKKVKNEDKEFIKKRKNIKNKNNIKKKKSLL